MDNLVWSCRRCNSSKGAALPSEWIPPDRQPFQREIITIHIESPNEPVVVWDVDFELGDVQVFAKAALDGELTERASGLSRRRFLSIREEALLHGFILWNNPAVPRQGLRMTAAGKQLFEQILQVKANMD